MIKHSIVLVPFPFDDFSSTKVRPAIGLDRRHHHHRTQELRRATPGRIPDEECTDMIASPTQLNILLPDHALNIRFYSMVIDDIDRVQELKTFRPFIIASIGKKSQGVPCLQPAIGID